jgi:hypothetical protein
MKLRTLIVAGGLVVAACVSGDLARAQQGPPPGGRQQGPRAGLRAGAPAITPGELERWLDAYVALQAQETLKLTDVQYPKFLQRLKAMQDTRRRNLQERRQILVALGTLMNSAPVDEPAVRERLKALHEHDLRAAAALQQARDAIDEVLDVQQQARFRLFEEAAERRKIDLLMTARQRAGGRGQQAPAPVK